MKHSEKRDKILAIFKDGSLLTAHEICERLPDVDRATIYRNLGLFVEQQILREVSLKKGISSYELQKEGDYHQHFICENCEKVIPIEVDPNFITNIIPKGVELDEFELNLKGKCKDCK